MFLTLNRFYPASTKKNSCFPRSALPTALRRRRRRRVSETERRNVAAKKWHCTDKAATAAAAGNKHDHRTAAEQRPDDVESQLTATLDSSNLQEITSLQATPSY